MSLFLIHTGIVKFYIRYNLRTLHIPEVHFPMKLRS